MSRLTREEIRAACEAVPGWEWAERQRPEGEETQYIHFDFAIAPGRNHFHPARPNSYNADAIALLEAWRGRRPTLWWIVESADDGYKAILMEGSVGLAVRRDSDLPTAAVRAVNAWAESRKESK